MACLRLVQRWLRNWSMRIGPLGRGLRRGENKVERIIQSFDCNSDRRFLIGSAHQPQWILWSQRSGKSAHDHYANRSSSRNCRSIVATLSTKRRPNSFRKQMIAKFEFDLIVNSWSLTKWNGCWMFGYSVKFNDFCLRWAFGRHRHHRHRRRLGLMKLQPNAPPAYFTKIMIATRDRL